MNEVEQHKTKKHTPKEINEFHLISETTTKILNIRLLTKNSSKSMGQEIHDALILFKERILKLEGV